MFDVFGEVLVKTCESHTGQCDFGCRELCRELKKVKKVKNLRLTSKFS